MAEVNFSLMPSHTALLPVDGMGELGWEHRTGWVTKPKVTCTLPPHPLAQPRHMTPARCRGRGMQSPAGSVFTLWGGSLNFGRQVAGLRAAGEGSLGVKRPCLCLVGPCVQTVC